MAWSCPALPEGRSRQPLACLLHAPGTVTCQFRAATMLCGACHQKGLCLVFCICIYTIIFGNEAEFHDFIERRWYLEVAKPRLLLPAAEGVVKKKTKGTNPSQRTDHKGLTGAKMFQQISARPKVHRSLTLTGFGVWLFWGAADLCGRALVGWMQTGKQRWETELSHRQSWEF